MRLLALIALYQGKALRGTVLERILVCPRNEPAPEQEKRLTREEVYKLMVAT